MIRHGEPWEHEAGPVDATVVRGDDAALAEALHTGRPTWYAPVGESDFVRVLGGAGGSAGPRRLTVDLLVLDGAIRAVNAIVLGVSPHEINWFHRSHPVEISMDGHSFEAGSGRATTIVVANGQFVGGHDAVPRGHPGDGVFEVQIYDVPRSQRRELRRRLRTGTHVPHPQIAQGRGRALDVVGAHPLPLVVDGIHRGRVRAIRVELLPGAGTLITGTPQ